MYGDFVSVGDSFCCISKERIDESDMIDHWNGVWITGTDIRSLERTDDETVDIYYLEILLFQ